MKIKESQLKEIIKNTLMESYSSCAWNGMPVGPKKKKKLTKSQKRERQESEEARENKNHEREMFNLMKKITESQLREIIRESITYILNEKAVSKSQQRFMGMVHAVQKGELDADEVGDSVAKAAKSMKKKDVKDFAETKHKGLPNHVDESKLVNLIRESIETVLSERNNRSFYEYASEYQEKHGEKLPDEQLKDAAKKNDERFHKRNNH